eukprot:TRINITY_DN1267_c0_g1_i2.p2 TRINITY_DN1267_c0_g1~~TRINITY_DN1267_c0_g1_i2.p2  ORF type:complete len:139 (-),score=26.40 TRINITY_DN1267_c0_g1_i2:323-739(-)
MRPSQASSDVVGEPSVKLSPTKPKPSDAWLRKPLPSPPSSIKISPIVKNPPKSTFLSERKNAEPVPSPKKQPQKPKPSTKPKKAKKAGKRKDKKASKGGDEWDMCDEFGADMLKCTECGVNFFRGGDPHDGFSVPKVP